MTNAKAITPSPLHSHVLQFEDLRQLSGRHHLAMVEKWARAQGIRYKYDGKGGIWTTVAALNVALGLSHYVDNEKYDEI